MMMHRGVGGDASGPKTPKKNQRGSITGIGDRQAQKMSGAFFAGIHQPRLHHLLGSSTTSTSTGMNNPPTLVGSSSMLEYSSSQYNQQLRPTSTMSASNLVSAMLLPDVATPDTIAFSRVQAEGIARRPIRKTDAKTAARIRAALFEIFLFFARADVDMGDQGDLHQKPVWVSTYQWALFAQAFFLPELTGISRDDILSTFGPKREPIDFLTFTELVADLAIAFIERVNDGKTMQSLNLGGDHTDRLAALYRFCEVFGMHTEQQSFRRFLRRRERIRVRSPSPHLELLRNKHVEVRSPVARPRGTGFPKNSPKMSRVKMLNPAATLFEQNEDQKTRHEAELLAQRQALLGGTTSSSLYHRPMAATASMGNFPSLARQHYISMPSTSMDHHTAPPPASSAGRLAEQQQLLLEQMMLGVGQGQNDPLLHSVHSRIITPGSRTGLKSSALQQNKITPGSTKSSVVQNSCSLRGDPPQHQRSSNTKVQLLPNTNTTSTTRSASISSRASPPATTKKKVTSSSAAAKVTSSSAAFDKKSASTSGQQPPPATTSSSRGGTASAASESGPGTAAAGAASVEVEGAAADEAGQEWTAEEWAQWEAEQAQAAARSTSEDQNTPQDGGGGREWTDEEWAAWEAGQQGEGEAWGDDQNAVEQWVEGGDQNTATGGDAADWWGEEGNWEDAEGGAGEGWYGEGDDQQWTAEEWAAWEQQG
ncbi:unnamed protein product [Amoebophrya sp. A25]|nr:unnamed protein product [Amoebophrya sp. A25]|eukprot:GSA25T00019537001.1